MSNREAAAASERPLPPFDDPRVQAVYAILCDDNEPLNGEHWEGFAARRIVAASAPQAVRMLSREEVRAVLPSPTNTRREFKGAECVQMTWHHFNQWAEAIQRAFAAKAGLVPLAPRKKK